MMFRRLAVLFGGFLLLCIAPSRAQEAVSSQMYGAGVHAYYAGDYSRAHELLTSAIGPAATARDPRMYYFRGLCYLRLGRDEEAKQDFEQGAKLEMSNTDETYNISKALERIQGADRQQLEQYRAHARLIAMQRAEEQRRARYEQLRRDEDRVLLNQSQPGSATPGPVPPPPEVTFGAGPAKAPAKGAGAAVTLPGAQEASPAPRKAPHRPQT